jgi:hypothetical protein
MLRLLDHHTQALASYSEDKLDESHLSDVSHL